MRILYKNLAEPSVAIGKKNQVAAKVRKLLVWGFHCLVVSAIGRQGDLMLRILLSDVSNNYSEFPKGKWIC